MPTLLAAGSNASAQLSIGHSNDVHLFTPCQFHHSISHLLSGSTILDLVSSSTHALLLLRDSTGASIVLGAGTNTLGQLGPRCALWDEVKPEPRFKPFDLLGPLGFGVHEWQPVRIAATWTTTFVVYERISREGAQGDREGAMQMVVACGSNDFGELGQGKEDADHVAVTQASDLPSVVELGLEEGEVVEMIKGGQRHVVVVISGAKGQRVIGWGASRKGELDAATLSSSGSGSHTASTSRKGKGKAVQATSPPTLIHLPTPPGARIMDIALGSAHSLALLSDGSVLAWGSDAKGQISHTFELRNVNQIAATWGGSYFLSDELLSQGGNGHSQLLRQVCEAPRGPVPLEGLKVQKLVAGSEHILVHGLNAKGEGVYVGGWNEHGNLGLGDTVDHPSLVQVDLAAYSGRVRGVWGGCAASWIWID